MISNNFLNKFITYTLSGILYITILIALLYCYFTNGSGFILLYTPLFIISTSIIGSIIYYLKHKTAFETFLVYISYIGIGFAFIFLAPFAVDRSLSTFIFFYAVEHQSYPQNKISTTYMEDFFEKRLKDGVNGGFLIKEDNIYKPTARAKLYYNLLYPLGYSTNMLNNYNTFKKELNKNLLKK